MIKISVVNNKTGQQSSAKFATQELADNWIAQERAIQSWGKVERWLPIDNLDGNDIADAIANEVRGESPNEKTWYKFPDEFTVSQSDVTAEVAAEAVLTYANKAQSFGAQLLTDIFAINHAKNLTSEQFDAILNDASLAKIERCLWQGSVNKAKELINALDETYFSTNEKNSIIAKIDAFIA